MYVRYLQKKTYKDQEIRTIIFQEFSLTQGE